LDAEDIDEALLRLVMDDVPLMLRAIDEGEGWLTDTTTAGMGKDWVPDGWPCALPLVELTWSLECECVEPLLAMLCASDAEAASKRDALSVSLPLAIDGALRVALAFLPLTLSRMPLPEWDVTPLSFHSRPNSPCTRGTLWSWWSVSVSVNAACLGRRWARWARMPVVWGASLGLGVQNSGLCEDGVRDGMVSRAGGGLRGLSVDERCRAVSVMAENCHRLSEVYKSVLSHVPLLRLPVIDSVPSDNEALPGLRFLRDELKRDCDVSLSPSRFSYIDVY
jgi:hypothetical protein